MTPSEETDREQGATPEEPTAEETPAQQPAAEEPRPDADAEPESEADEEQPKSQAGAGPDAAVDDEEAISEDDGQDLTAEADDEAESATGEARASGGRRPRRRLRPKRAGAGAEPAAGGGPERPRAKRTPRLGKGATPTQRRVVRARARYVRTSARKARMVCRHLRGKSVEEARAILAFTPRDVARAWSKLLESAVANAESNHELLEDDLFIREAYADEGPTIKRFRPRAMGRATPIRKRTSHLTITLTTIPTKREGR